MANSWAPRSPDLSAYAPKSPDLSAYHQQPPSLVHNSDSTASWAPQSPDVSAFHSYDNQAPLHQQPPPQFNLDSTWDLKQQFQDHYLSPQYPQYPQQNPAFQPQIEFDPNMPAQTRGHRMSYKEEPVKEEEEDYAPPPTTSKRGRRAVKPNTESISDPDFGSIPTDKPKMDTSGVEVKTKFPTARIKRIMQADEDVGKVAQVTPVVVAKALELFMIRLITSSATVARSRGSKRVLTSHMKAAVMEDDQFDNLREIVDKVPDAPTKSKDDEDEEEGEGKKRKKSSAATPGRGKKRRDSDDDF